MQRHPPSRRHITLLIALIALLGATHAQELRVGLFRLPDHLDIGRGLSNTDHAVPYSIFDSLVHRDHTTEELSFVPGLATDWRYLDDTTIEFDLRPDVVFHDGTPLHASDVKFSFERLGADDYPSTFGYNIAFSTIDRVEVVDATTVRIVLVRPDPAIFAILSMPQAAIVPQAYIQEVGYEGFGLMPVGTGPYRVTEFAPGELVVAERFDPFWGDAAPVERITYRAIPELVTRVTSLVNGEVDIITHVPPDQVPTIEGAGCCTVEGLLTPIFHVLFFNTQHPHIADERVRQAMSLAIDRELLVESLWAGEALVPRGHQFALYGDLYDGERQVIPYDPERARALLDEAGYAGEEIVYNINDGYYTNGLTAAQAIVEMWRDVGLDARINLNPDDYWSYETAMANAWSNPVYFPDPAGSYGVMWAPGGIRGSEVAWIGEHPEYEALYDAFRYELDVDVRRERYGEVLDYWETFVPGTILYQPIEYYGVADGVDWRPLPGTQPYILDFRADSLTLR